MEISRCMCCCGNTVIRDPDRNSSREGRWFWIERVSVHHAGKGTAVFVAVGVCVAETFPILVDQEEERSWNQELG